MRSAVTNSRTLRSTLPAHGTYTYPGMLVAGLCGVGKLARVVVPGTKSTRSSESGVQFPNRSGAKPGLVWREKKVNFALSQYWPTKCTTAPASMPCNHDPDGPS